MQRQMKKTRRQAQETRNQILDAAEWVFAEHGVARTSLADVAVRAGRTHVPSIRRIGPYSKAFSPSPGRAGPVWMRPELWMPSAQA